MATQNKPVKKTSKTKSPKISESRRDVILDKLPTKQNKRRIIEVEPDYNDFSDEEEEGDYDYPYMQDSNVDDYDDFEDVNDSLFHRNQERRKQKEAIQDLKEEVMHFCDHRYAGHSKKYYVLSIYDKCMIVAKKITREIKNTANADGFQPHESTKSVDYCVNFILAFEPKGHRDSSLKDEISEIPEVNDFLRVGCLIYRINTIDSVKDVLSKI